MTQTAYPKVGGSTTDDEYRALIASLVETGATTQTGYLAAGDSTGMNVKVAAGLAFVDGITAKSTATEPLTIGAAPASGQSRKDTVVLQLDYTQTPIVQLKVIAGTPATTGTEAAPSLAIAGNVKYNWPIADVAVAGGAVTITAGNVTDRRTITGTNVGLWTTATRPGAPRTGRFGYNLTTNLFESWTGAAWASISIGSSGIADSTVLGRQFLTTADLASARELVGIRVTNTPMTAGTPVGTLRFW